MTRIIKFTAKWSYNEVDPTNGRLANGAGFTGLGLLGGGGDTPSRPVALFRYASLVASSGHGTGCGMDRFGPHGLWDSR